MITAAISGREAGGLAEGSNGWIERLHRPGAVTGPLKGKTFGVKDLYQARSQQRVKCISEFK